MIKARNSERRSEYRKLTDADKDAIRRSTETPKYLAHIYGCGLSTVYKVINDRKTIKI